MANAEHLEILKSGVEKWNKWRDENKEIIPDLYNAQLPDSDLSGANLSLAILDSVNLDGANLRGAKLICAGLRYAHLRYSHLNEVNMASADLCDANLSGANLSGVILGEANLTDAILNEANLDGANLGRANLTHTRLHNTKFNNAFLEFTIFGQNNLSTCKGLESVEVNAPCIIDFQTLRASKNLPKSFLLKIGLPELFIDYLPEFYGDALNFYPVFLSHSWANKPFARKLYEALIAKGVNVFFDEKKMKPGDDMYESISKGISLYDKMILVCSKESLSESWWVDRELDRILKKERDLFKERGQRINLLIPITIDDFVFSWDGAKAEEVRRYIIGDFKDWQDEAKFEKALNDLIHALNADRPDVKPKSLL